MPTTTHPPTPAHTERPALALSARSRATLALSTAALLWSGNFIAGRALRDDLSPLTLNLLRWALCLLVMLPWVGASVWRHRHAVRREWRLLFALGATGIAAFHTLVYLALQTTPAVNALLMLSLTPAAILLGGTLGGGPSPSRRQWAGTGLSLLGAGVLVTRGNGAALLGLAPAPGDLWMLLAVPLWAAYSRLLSRRPADLPQPVVLACSIAPALVLLLAATLATPAGAPLAVAAAALRAQPWLLAAVAYVAVFASLIAFMLWSYGVTVIGPEAAGQFVHLMPLFGALLALLLLGEALVPAQGAGALCVLAGIGLVQAGTRPR